MSRKIRNKGQSNFVYILSIIKTALFSVWSFSYIVCLFLRNNAFNSAVKSLTLSGYTTYTVEVSSPFFVVLKVVAFLIPVALLIWTIAIYRKGKYGQEPLQKLLPLLAFGVTAVAAIICALDITSLHMIF